MPLLKFVFSSAGPLALAACTTVGPDYAAPDPGGLTASDIQVDGAAKSVDREPAQRWWMVFEDETLNSLIETAFNENRDLRRAAANVEAARSLLNLDRVNLRPTGEARAAYQRRRLTGAAFGLDELDFDDSEFFDIGVNAAWELDFFGRVRRATEAALAGAQTAEYLRRDAQVLIAAETARAYIEYRGAALQLDVAKRNLSVQRNSARLTQRRLDEGLGSRLDVARAEAQAKTTEASIPPLEAAQIAAANRLATLTGANVNDVLSAWPRANKRCRRRLTRCPSGISRPSFSAAQTSAPPSAPLRRRQPASASRRLNSSRASRSPAALASQPRISQVSAATDRSAMASARRSHGPASMFRASEHKLKRLAPTLKRRSPPTNNPHWLRLRKPKRRSQHMAANAYGMTRLRPQLRKRARRRRSPGNATMWVRMIF